ncbi:hypothetical protein CHL78_007475 [Romboutsia weinsteinii]|uniref:Uncharacterized protein n=1 Tax=Romboutsia weinsteinii TaxID=2020949 RepID=A0A371J587_9FIRM|nr:hypothetical protein [Romboutsia weinsteinii]RDY27836.1 hypothetical protein CHL78_007475 [Romboutsia weinsteinii]
MINKKLIITIIVFFIGSSMIGNCIENKYDKLIFGGTYIEERNLEDGRAVENSEQEHDLERFFRPSKSPILNNKIEKTFYDLYGTNTSNYKIPDKFLKRPEDTIINYFSILREAANPLDDTKTGCGSLGDTRGPYPIAYKFLSEDYQKRVSYEEYLKSFENILHINLIKANQVGPDENKKDVIKYFVELETIEGTNEHKGVFAYYYGYVYLKNENGVYKIVDMKYTPENYLCAPYHGWSYDAKSFVEIEYGGWCSLIDGETRVEESGYEKKVYFKDKDKNEYYVLFYQLTDGVDIKIADYKKDKDGKWKQVYINPEKCLDKKKN